MAHPPVIPRLGNDAFVDVQFDANEERSEIPERSPMSDETLLSRRMIAPAAKREDGNDISTMCVWPNKKYICI